MRHRHLRQETLLDDDLTPAGLHQVEESFETVDVRDLARREIGRPTDVDMLAMQNVYVTGDWVGPVGMLSDTSLASARRVAEHLGAVETKAAA